MQSCVLDWEDSRLPYNGFAITEKGRSTEIYMYVALRNARVHEACFHGSVENFLPKNFDYRWLGRAEKNHDVGDVMNLDYLLIQAASPSKV